MKKLFLATTIVIALILNTNAQEEFKPSGSGIGTVFTNYHYDLTKDATQQSAFQIDRAYLGYKYNFAKNVSAKVVFDVAYKNGLYTAYAKNALLAWTIAPKFKLSAGLIGLTQFNTQEKFWGYRYVMKTHADEHGLGTSADLGVNLEIPLNDMFTFNVFVLNGDGYKAVQDAQGLHRFGANVIAKPIKGLILKAHYDMMAGKDNAAPADTSTIGSLSVFAGYQMDDKFRVGIEYNSLMNGKGYSKYNDQYNLSGISIYATYIINKQIELYARYDNLVSNNPNNTTDNWNNSKDGSMILGGIQYQITKKVNVSLNYRTWIYSDSKIDPTSALYLNLGLSF